MHAKSYALVVGLEPVRENCSSLHLVLELGDLRSLESDNRVIARAIGLKFAGSSEMICTNNLINAIEKILKLRFKYDRA